MKCINVISISLLFVIFGCQEDTSLVVGESEEDAITEILPFQVLQLEDLSEFRTEGNNWNIAGAVSSDFHNAWDLTSIEGTGVLISSVEDEGKRDQKDAAKGVHIFTKLEHGDIELELEVLVPKESNSGLYFQSRYELQIRDTSGDDDVSSDDMGGIYAQWANPGVSEELKEGSAPLINAARAPGLWQKYKVLFRSPKFDVAGNKITNARFEHVYLNGYLIQENVEVSSPTIEAAFNDEVEQAPLMIQGDHGPIAFRNIKYKIYSKDKVVLSNLTYRSYDGKYDYIPDFSKLEIVNEGEAENFEDLTEIAGKNEGFSIEFEGDLNIPHDGDYLFETDIDDGGNLYIDDSLIVHNQGEPGAGNERGVINLTKGIHRLRQSYYQEVWGAHLALLVEGPNMEKGRLPALEESGIIPSRPKHTLKVEVNDEPELIRGFVDHHDTKKTHILSVGTPEGVHYSYDTRNNELINLWKGGFADVARMWVNRGATQRLDPVAAELGLEQDKNNNDCRPLGYTLDPAGIPIFNYTCDGIMISDRTGPSDTKGVAVRNISVDKGKYRYVFASGEGITEISDGWYSVDNRYFIKPKTNGASWQVIGDEIIATVTQASNLSYEIYW